MITPEGDTNRERMSKGKAPYTESGEKVQLHHIGQKNDSPLAELTRKEHSQNGNDTILHEKRKVSEIVRKSFGTVRKKHWKERITMLE